MLHTTYRSWVVLCQTKEHSDVTHPLVLLRPARRERPGSRRTDEQRDEVASPHRRPSSGLGRTLPHRCGKIVVLHHSKNCALMSHMGHSRRFGVGRESAWPHIADILGATFIRRDVP